MSSTNPLLAGAAQRDITPALPVEKGSTLASFKATEVLSPLTAQALAWEKEGEAAVWVSVDVGVVTTPLVRFFRGIVSERTGLPEERIHITATHTHGAPSSPTYSFYRNEELEAQVQKTFASMMEKAAEAAVEAYANRRPVRMGYGRGQAERAGFNRRYIMSNGKSTNLNNWVFIDNKSDRDLVPLQPEGPVDSEVLVVWFEDCDSAQIVGALVNYASHPSRMARMKKLGAEYPGEMRAGVCRALDRQFPIVFLQGCLGNVNSNDVGSDPEWGCGEEGIRTTGLHLAGEVVKILNASRTVPTEGMVLAQAQRLLEIPYRSFPEDEVQETLDIIREGMKQENRFQFFDRYWDTLEKAARAKMITYIDHLKKGGETGALDLMGIRLGDVVIVANPAQLFIEYQIAFKKEFPGKPVMLANLTDGFINYVPTPLAVALGGYETEHRLYDPDGGAKILEASIALVHQLNEIE